jgi:hypothetical protein
MQWFSDLYAYDIRKIEFVTTTNSAINLYCAK